MTGAEFWASTPREFAARRKVFEQQREFTLSLYAGIQATMHNAHFRTDRNQPVFTPDMFMPGYKKPEQDTSWRTFKAQAEMMRKMTPEEREILTENQRNFDERQSRAAAAKARGASAREIIAIMEGRDNHDIHSDNGDGVTQ